MAVEFLKGEEAEVKAKGQKQALVVFYATWCGPCQMYAPILEEVSSEIPVYKVDLDANRDFVRKLGVKGVPTTLIYEDGKLANQFSGFVPAEVLKTRIGK